MKILRYTVISQFAILSPLQEAETCSDRYSVTDYRITSSDGSINVSVDALSNFNNYTVRLDQENAPNLVRGRAYDVSVVACNNLTCKESQAILVCK